MAETGWFTYDDFADRTGDEFVARAPEGDDTSVALTLAEATVQGVAGGTGPDGSTRQQFSLLFRGPAEAQLSQGLWLLEHATMGELALFLVPLGPDAEGPRYEAAFA
ncbi:hypothetical protein F0U44_15915 [Nocardioides humilatus]|uniref:DUF6916 domain-containing protein n=1 Tax=Nocardioides humilatus TaxID=2607660 RepID=A0A5B1LBG2_9ACTN|nr:hypothetical protein [Nocardioides humilatus]KAA1417776.1 hypothetical protein F0U44_15915 [Nocardioides humilatus]